MVFQHVLCLCFSSSLACHGAVMMQAPFQGSQPLQAGDASQQQEASGEDAGQDSSMQEDGAFPGGMFTVEGHALMVPHSQGGHVLQQHLPRMASSFSSEAFLPSGLPSATSHGYDPALPNFMSAIGNFMGPQTPQSSNPLQLDSTTQSPNGLAMPGLHPATGPIGHGQGQGTLPGGQMENDNQVAMGHGLQEQQQQQGGVVGGGNGVMGGHQSSERVRRQQAIVDQCLGNPLPVSQQAGSTPPASSGRNPLQTPPEGSKDTETEDTLEDLGMSSPASVAASDVAAGASQPLPSSASVAASDTAAPSSQPVPSSETSPNNDQPLQPEAAQPDGDLATPATLVTSEAPFEP